ncbi:MAG TPA: hypothetical protein VH394_26800 [Thermoanaerobaculia bacterium]|jgi:hypothetical protein|nr:hypothetical protein [Thermoanaerobaculia bacterium]
MEATRISGNETDAGRVFRVLAPPLIWAAQQQASYALTPSACAAGAEGWLHLISLAALVAVLATAFLSHRDWKRLPEGSTDEGMPGASRSRFLALSGIVIGLFFALVIVATDVPNWILGACSR